MVSGTCMGGLPENDGVSRAQKTAAAPGRRQRPKGRGRRSRAPSGLPRAEAQRSLHPWGLRPPDPPPHFWADPRLGLSPSQPPYAWGSGGRQPSQPGVGGGRSPQNEGVWPDATDFRPPSAPQPNQTKPTKRSTAPTHGHRANTIRNVSVAAVWLETKMHNGRQTPGPEISTKYISI